jgi:hypothetical protein
MSFDSLNDLILYISFLFSFPWANCSSSLDSPATSMQDMAGGRAREAATSSLGGGESSSVASGQLTSSSQQFPSTQSYWDSDFETEPDPPDWRHSINQDELAQLNPREKQRQDVINGESQILISVSD